MSDKSDAKQFQRVINALMMELNASRKGQRVIVGNIVKCIRILNNTIPEKTWRFRTPPGLKMSEPIDDNNGGNA